MRSVRLALVALPILTLTASAADLLPPDRPATNVIDSYIEARLARSGATPASQVDDYTLIRRLTLDLVGRIPTPRETREFVESTDPNKREQLVDRLMASPAFVRHQANEFDAMLAGPNGTSRRRCATISCEPSARTDRGTRSSASCCCPTRPTRRRRAPASSSSRASPTSIELTNDVSVTFFGVNVSLRPVPRSSARQRLEAGPLLRHEVVLRPHLRQRRLPRRTRVRHRQVQADQGAENDRRS